MRIAIVENERREIEGAFDYANFKYFNNSLEYEYFEGSQQFLKSSNLDSFKLILVDIDLSKRSVLDGYSLIKTLLEKNAQNLERIVIITGHHKVEETLKERGLPAIPVIYKPTDFNQIFGTFKMKGIGPLR